MASSKPQAHKARGRERGRGPTRLQPWEWFILLAHHHLLNETTANEMAVEHIIRCGHPRGRAAAMLEEDRSAWAARIPSPEQWANAYRCLSSEPVSIDWLMLDFVLEQLAASKDNDAAEEHCARYISAASFAAAMVHGLHGPAERWPKRKLMTHQIATILLSAHQWRGLSIKEAASRAQIALSTAYRLLGKKSA